MYVHTIFKRFYYRINFIWTIFGVSSFNLAASKCSDDRLKPFNGTCYLFVSYPEGLYMKKLYLKKKASLTCDFVWCIFPFWSWLVYSPTNLCWNSWWIGISEHSWRAAVIFMVFLVVVVVGCDLKIYNKNKSNALHSNLDLLPPIFETSWIIRHKQFIGWEVDLSQINI